MHWWQGAFASSKSNSNSSADDSDIRFTLTKPASFFSMRRSRHIQRARKLRNVSESDAAPQPLPLPELQVLLRRDPKFTRNSAPSLPLPSPTDAAVDVSKDRCSVGEKNVVDGVHVHKRFISQDATSSADYESFRKSPPKQNTITKSSGNISVPSSAPSSPFSSFTLSPPRNDFMATPYLTPPGVFQVWSAPEMPHSDRNLGLGFYNQFSYEASRHSFDNSPLQSPRKSVNIPATSPPMPTSPLTLRYRENNVQASVHPLPLPPVAHTSLQPVPISPVPDFSGASLPILNSSHVAKPEYQVLNAASLSAPISPVASKPIKSTWQKGKLIGRGTFGSVYVASNRETGALCAMKEVEILPDDSKSAECIRQLEQEINVLSHLKHPNIVQYYGSEIVGDKFHIYLEYVHPGSINRFIQDHCGAITESVVRNFTRHILCGLAYLHSTKTIHRDIKGANLLVDAYGVVKLADFGMAKHLTGQVADLSLKGSPYWMAPELLQSAMQKDSSSDVALAVDIWSLGCTIIEMMNGKPPWSEYEGAAALFKVLQETPPIPESMSADGKDFLQCCFRRNPADRPTASMLLNHPFLNYSQPPDACTQSLNEMKLSDNTHFLRERPNNKTEKPGNTETSQQNNHQQIFRQIALAAIPCPRSTLESLPRLSINGFGNHPDSSYITANYQKGF